jgi:aminoglycoside 3-N-acetyltransferase
MEGAYSKQELEKSLKAVGIKQGDVVSLQVSLGRLGPIKDVPTRFDDIAKNVIDIFLNLLGSNGTLLVPAYTYSLGKGEIFDADKTPSAIGEFPEIFRKMKMVKRSRDPMLSTCALGRQSKEITEGISNSCYGEGSLFENLRKNNAKICMLGIGLHWATFRHYIEKMAEVPFRFDKKFEGKIKENNKIVKEVWTYFAAPLGVPNCEPYGIPLEKIATEAKLLQKCEVGRGEIISIEAQKYFDLGVKELKTNPWLTAKGPPIEISNFITKELCKNTKK